jgi:hypothetical protein
VKVPLITSDVGNLLFRERSWPKGAPCLTSCSIRWRTTVVKTPNEPLVARKVAKVVAGLHGVAGPR